VNKSDAWYGRRVHWYESPTKIGMIVADSRIQDHVIVEWDITCTVDTIHINDLTIVTKKE
jgi:hypothetical protein